MPKKNNDIPRDKAWLASQNAELRRMRNAKLLLAAAMDAERNLQRRASSGSAALQPKDDAFQALVASYEALRGEVETERFCDELYWNLRSIGLSDEDEIPEAEHCSPSEILVIASHAEGLRLPQSDRVLAAIYHLRRALDRYNDVPEPDEEALAAWRKAHDDFIFARDAAENSL